MAFPTRAAAVFRTAVAALALTTAASLASPAAADWRRAESPRFIVYSDGSEGLLREYIGKLEIFDHYLRSRFNVADTAAPRRLPVYLLANRSALTRVRPDIGRYVAGFYAPSGEDIFAVALRGQDDDYLLHEYFHHFSFQAGEASGYPGWLIEGLAEYYMTAEFEDDAIVVGNVNADRAAWLGASSWIPLEELLSKRPQEVRRGQHANTYYSVAWLMTHWFLSDPTRSEQLRTYVADMQSGTDSVTAMQRATGMTLAELRLALNSYTVRPLISYRFELNVPEPEIVVTRLPRSADDLLLLGQRLKGGVQEKDSAETAALIRRVAARHPEDPFATLQLGHAELHFGDADAGEVILTQLLEQEPENVEALQLMATRRTKQAEDRPDQAQLLLGRARSYLARAFKVDPDNYYTLYLMARSREGAATYPNANDIVTWGQAFALAPQLPGIRLGYAAALMRTGEFDLAQRLLAPLASAAHGGAAIQAAQTLLDRARAGQPPLTAAEIDAATEAEEQTSPEGVPVPPAPDSPAEPGDDGDAEADEQTEPAPDTAAT